MKPQRNTRAKALLIGRENSEAIPVDLIIEILSRLPLKSIGRCWCVSKLWSSILHLPYFTELFFNRSSARPHLLLAYEDKDKILFLSSPQPQNPDENSSLVAPSYLSHVPVGDDLYYSCDHVHGLIYLSSIDKPISIICNPSTGQTQTLDKVDSVASYLGYDPIDKQFKVLSIARGSTRLSLLKKHQVLTLGTQKLEWRMIECCIPYCFRLKGICINGVVYYPAIDPHRPLHPIIVCFDVRFEKFSCIEVEMTFYTAVFRGTLVNYNGKLGSLKSERFQFIDKTSESLELLVIGDFEKQEWSTHKYMLPPLWKNVVGEAVFLFVGVIGANKIVLSHPFYVIYYNIENNTLVKVGIQGTEKFNINSFSTFLDHREDLKLMEAF